MRLLKHAKLCSWLQAPAPLRLIDRIRQQQQIQQQQQQHQQQHPQLQQQHLALPGQAAPGSSWPADGSIALRAVPQDASALGQVSARGSRVVPEAANLEVEVLTGLRAGKTGQPSTPVVASPAAAGSQATSEQLQHSEQLETDAAKDAQLPSHQQAGTSSQTGAAESQEGSVVHQHADGVTIQLAVQTPSTGAYWRQTDRELPSLPLARHGSAPQLGSGSAAASGSSEPLAPVPVQPGRATAVADEPQLEPAESPAVAHALDPTPAAAPDVGQRQALVQAAPPQAPGLVRHDDEPMAFEEVIGLRGPIRLLFENAGTVIFSSAMFMAGALWLPFTWGRITIRGIAMIQAAWKLTVLPTAAMQLLLKNYQARFLLHMPMLIGPC